MGDVTKCTVGRGTLSLKVPSTAGSFVEFQAFDIEIECSADFESFLIPQVSSYKFHDECNETMFKVSAKLADVTAAQLVAAFPNASETSGTITFDDAPVYCGVQLVIDVNPNHATLDTVTITIPYALCTSGGTLGLQSAPHGFPMSFEARKQDSSTEVVSIVVAGS